MYWNNPTIQIRYPGSTDPILDSLHDGRHCLFFDPTFPIKQIQPLQTLDELCAMANAWLKQHPVSDLWHDLACQDWMANIVKINLMVNNITQIGCAKPMLLFYHGLMPVIPGTGDSRLKALSRISNMHHVPAFISTSAEFKHVFEHLVQVSTFDIFAQCCKIESDTTFSFRLTDNSASHGLDWYEYDSKIITLPDSIFCLRTLEKYLDQRSSNFEFCPQWFDTLVDWDAYQ
jgi:hypothetical protein